MNRSKVFSDRNRSVCVVETLQEHRTVYGHATLCHIEHSFELRAVKLNGNFSIFSPVRFNNFYIPKEAKQTTLSLKRKEHR